MLHCCQLTLIGRGIAGAHPIRPVVFHVSFGKRTYLTWCVLFFLLLALPRTTTVHQQHHNSARVHSRSVPIRGGTMRLALAAAVTMGVAVTTCSAEVYLEECFDTFDEERWVQSTLWKVR